MLKSKLINFATVAVNTNNYDAIVTASTVTKLSPTESFVIADFKHTERQSPAESLRSRFRSSDIAELLKINANRHLYAYDLNFATMFIRVRV